MSPALRLMLGLILPVLLVGAAILCVPLSAGSVIGVSARGWALFLCAPITCLLLSVCARR